MSRRDSLMVLVRSGGACALPLSLGFFLVTQYNIRHVLLYRASYARSLGTFGYSRGHSASLGPPPGCARGVSVFVVLQLPHFRWLRATRSGLVVVYFDKWLQHLAQARQYLLDLETSSVARLHRLSFNPGIRYRLTIIYLPYLFTS